MSHQPAIALRDLAKTYRRPDGGVLRAVDGLSFEVASGEVFALLGPNGAGKTTTLEILEGLCRPTSGQAQVLGLDVVRDRREIAERVGVQLQSSSYFEHLTLAEILELFGSFYRRRLPPGELLDLVGLADRRRALVRQLSGGQAQRFSIVAALVNDPEIVFLDEPTAGLDPQARRSVWELVERINRAHGKTVVLTTHYMEEAEGLAHRVAVIDHGQLQALDSPSRLVRALADSHRIRFRIDGPGSADELARLPGVAGVEPLANGEPIFRLAVDDPSRTVPALFAWASERAVEIRELAVSPVTLEDVFLSLTGRSLRD